jgi:hypothetical protein
MALAAIGFVMIFAFQRSIPWLGRTPMLQSLYVHASNGFYVDVAVGRLVERLWVVR